MEKENDDSQTGEGVNTEENYDNLKHAGGKKRKGKKKNNKGAEIKPRSSFHANEISSSPKKEETISHEAERKKSENADDKQVQEEETKAEHNQDQHVEEENLKKEEEPLIIIKEESVKLNEHHVENENLIKNGESNLAEGDEKIDSDEKMGTKDGMTNNDIQTENQEQTQNELNTVELINENGEHSKTIQEENSNGIKSQNVEEGVVHSPEKEDSSKIKVSENTKSEEHTHHTQNKEETSESHPEESPGETGLSSDAKNKTAETAVRSPVKEAKQSTEEVTHTPSRVEDHTSVEDFTTPLKKENEEKTQIEISESPKKESTLANPQEEERPVETSTPKKEADLANPHIEEEITIKSVVENLTHAGTNTVQSEMMDTVALPQTSSPKNIIKTDQSGKDKKQSTASEKFNGVNNNFSEEKVKYTDSMKMVDKIDIDKEKDQNLIELRQQNTSEGSKKDKDRGFCTKCLIF